ncbi:S53 family peptidase [Aspergillus ibericus CBS 121593]|uniref:tripeptidyl-peptidase II n=1 Tax=Aspergillus ibericus CBS 121593 TaxID=1448316 RepID=A0A395GMG6_9EURO|nr:tripeptidyl-peptidase sed3 [Aspergillus ibericus CBS 121593]RAK96168.1 tripeptidyl-peptidase sed3 [Aspergillus ibericus CBS 121593]
MIYVKYLIGLLSLFHAAVAARSRYVVVEQLNSVPSGWEKGATPSPSTSMKFWLAIDHEYKAEFEQKVIDLSTPGHQSYGKHMKREDVRAFLRPSDQASETILSWLESELVPSDSIKEHGDWIAFTVPLSKAESMMRTEFHSFHRPGTNVTQIRTLKYSVPENIDPYLQMIQPTTHFGQPKTQTSLPGFVPVTIDVDDPNGNCSTAVTPGCLRQLYGIFDTRADPDPSNVLGVSGYLDQYARYSDLEQFMDVYAPNSTGANFSVVSINGGLNLQSSSQLSTEASLDIQYAIAVAYDANTTFYTTAGRGPSISDLGELSTDGSTNEPYLEQLLYLLDLPDDELPAVLSTSYGEDEQSVPEQYTRATCNLFAQLGARGVSVIFSSGDSGVGGSCLSNDGTQSIRFQPIFPASCPFVTAVGGTEGVNPERAVEFSGGGFSERFARPSYQNASVQSYLNSLGGKWDGLYNPNGRGIPDVAAQASSFVIRDHGEWLQTAGTSAAAPVFAAIISLLNAARLQQGKPTLGFLNPWLYSLNQTGFTDIVHGGSVGCDGLFGGALVPYASWNATKGWDPVTGLGTPFYQTLEQIVKDS